MTTKISLHDCYKQVRLAVARHIGGAELTYAASYAQIGLDLPDAMEPEQLTDEARVQALYVRTNMSHWRSSAAKDIRSNIDRILRKK